MENILETTYSSRRYNQSKFRTRKVLLFSEQKSFYIFEYMRKKLNKEYLGRFEKYFFMQTNDIFLKIIFQNIKDFFENT